MDLYSYNTNKKRKFSQSKEREENLKRKTSKNEESIGCFRRCCTRKKHELISIQKEKIIKISSEKIPLENENINQSLKADVPIQTVSIEKVSNVPMTSLKRSPLYHESTFSQTTSESYYDPCIECTVVKEKPTNEISNNVNSFINDIIGDGVDRISEIIITMSTYRNRTKEVKIDNPSSINSENDFQRNDLKSSPSDFEKRRPHQYPGLVFENQNLKKTSPLNHHSSIDLVLGNASSQIIPDDYNWNLASNEVNIDQQKVLDRRNSLQDQEPYNWDYQEYQWSSPLDSSQKTQLIDKVMNDQSNQSLINNNDRFLSDNDSTDLSYSITSVLPSNQSKKAQSRSNDLKISTPSLNILHQQQTFSTPKSSESVDRISDDRNKNEHSQQKLYLNESNDLTHTNSNQQQTILSIFSKGKDLVSRINFTHSSQFNHDKLQAKNSSDINSNNDTLLSENLSNPSSEIFHQHETQEQNNRLSTTSVSDLFKQITHTKKQKLMDLDSISTTYSLPVAVHPSVVSPEAVIDQDDKNDVPSSRTTLSERRLPVSSNTETKQLKSVVNMNINDQTGSININRRTERAQSHLTDIQENQSSSTEINNILYQVRSTYDNIMNSWRHLLERLLSFMLPSIRNTDHHINLSPSIITSNTRSWSTLIPTETLNMIQSDNIGPWWGRRNTDDRIPATFIFANESLSVSYSLEPITNNIQMCIPIENRPCCFKYYSYPNTCHGYCSSSITINNSLSSS